MGAKFPSEIFRLLSSVNVSVASGGGAQASTAAFGSQTYAVQLLATSLNSTAGSTGGVRVVVTDSTTGVVTSNTDVLIAPNFPFVYKVTPGQRVAALGADGGVYNLNVVQLTN